MLFRDSPRAALLSLLLFVPPLTFAQSNTATLSGTITDPSDALVPGVNVSVVNPDTGLARKTTTDTSGFYRLDLLPPGS
jgi:hypothetical protein